MKFYRYATGFCVIVSILYVFQLSLQSYARYTLPVFTGRGPCSRPVNTGVILDTRPASRK